MLDDVARTPGLLLYLHGQFIELGCLITVTLQASTGSLRIVLDRDQGLIDLVGNAGDHGAQGALFTESCQPSLQFVYDRLRLCVSIVFVLQRYLCAPQSRPVQQQDNNQESLQTGDRYSNNHFGSVLIP